MQRAIDIPDSMIRPGDWSIVTFFHFLQLMANRRTVGSFRYGKPNRKQKYLSRLKREVAEYEKTHNMEQLLNIAVYAFLESEAPEKGRVVFDNTIDSVTRGEFGTGGYGAAQL